MIVLKRSNTDSTSVGLRKQGVGIEAIVDKDGPRASALRHLTARLECSGAAGAVVETLETRGVDSWRHGRVTIAVATQQADFAEHAGVAIQTSAITLLTFPTPTAEEYQSADNSGPDERSDRDPRHSTIGKTIVRGRREVVLWRGSRSGRSDCHEVGHHSSAGGDDLYGSNGCWRPGRTGLMRRGGGRIGRGRVGCLSILEVMCVSEPFRQRDLTCWGGEILEAYVNRYVVSRNNRGWFRRRSGSRRCRDVLYRGVGQHQWIDKTAPEHYMTTILMAPNPDERQWNYLLWQ